MDQAQQTLLKTHLAEVYTDKLPALILPSPVEEKNRQKNISRALSAFVLHRLCGATLDAACASIVDDFGDLGLDAIYYNPDSKTLYLLQSKLKASADFTQEEANGFCQGVRKLITCDFSGFNQHVTSRTVEIEDALDKCDQIQLVVAHLGDVLKQHPAQSIADLIADKSHGEERLAAEVENINGAAIMGALQGVNAYKQVDSKLELFDWAKLSSARKSYIAFAKLADLARLHQEHGRALYAKNIRAFLGHQTDVNTSITKTLETAPSDFAFLNNGVTILCRQVMPLGGGRERKRFQIVGLSIVNGAQTVASAARFIANTPNPNISDARVLVTVIVADGEDEFGKNVTRSRNHQNAIRNADFIALDPEQERLRRELALLGIRYAYQAEALDDADDSIITVEQAAFALAMLEPDPRLPVMTKRGAANLQSVGEYPYNALFSPSLTAYRVRNSVAAFRYIMKRMNEEVRATSDQQERLTYRHGAYVLAFILMKRLRNEIDGHQALDAGKLASVAGPQLDALRQKLWDETKAFMGERGPLAIYRNQSDVNSVVRLSMTAHYGLTTDQALPQLLAIDTTTQTYPERLFKYLSSKAPQIGSLT